MTQDCKQACRFNPERTVKDTKPGVLNSTILKERIIQEFKNPVQQKKVIATEDIEMKEVNGDKWDPNNPYELIRID